VSASIFCYQKVLKAYFNCRINKRKSISAISYELQLEKNLAELTTQLQQRTYVPDRLVCFVITKPKAREIFASEFADRITHHILINEVEKVWEKDIFITDSYACRKGKGHHFATQRVYSFAQKYRYYGQFDIKNFFSSISKQILFEQFSKVIVKQHKPDFWKDDILWLAKTIIFNDPTHNAFYKGDPKLKLLLPHQKSLFEQDEDIGMPIGNLSSQFLANVYMHELDAFVTNELKIPAYARYVDDFIIFSNSKEEIINARNAMSKFLITNLKLTLHPKKQQIQPTKHGIPFVGYFIRHTGIQVRRNVVKAVKNKLYTYKKLPDPDAMITSLNSYYGHFRIARSYNLRKHLFFEHIDPKLRPHIWIIGNWQYFRLTKSRKLKNKQ
jgi:RNA-directed DNA polymerase